MTEPNNNLLENLMTSDREQQESIVTHATNGWDDGQPTNQPENLTTERVATESSPLPTTNRDSREMSSVYENRNKNELRAKKTFSFNLLLTNARSLAPKLESLIEHITEYDISAAIVSESWLRPGAQLEQEIDDLRKAEGLDLIHHSRKLSKKGRPAGGGVAIITKRSTCILKEFKITRGRAEIVCAVGRVIGCSRKIALIGAYISPRCKAAQVNDALEKLCDAIRKIKETFNDPFITIGGDFNRAKVEDALGEFPDLQVVCTPPTRGQANLDKIATNFDEDIINVKVRPPLTGDRGQVSDHNIVIIQSNLLQSDRFTAKKIKVRPRTKDGYAKFKQLIENEDWTSITRTDFTVDQMVDGLEELTTKWTNEAFPEKTFHVKSTDLPWMNYEIKCAIRRRKRIYDKTMKRTGEWKEAKNESDRLLKKAKREYFEKMKDLAREKRSASIYFKAVTKLKDQEKTPQFDIRSLYPEYSDHQICNDVANYFNKITENFEPLSNETDNTVLPDCIIVNECDVSSRLRSCKKPKSMVKGDVFPDLIDCYAEKWAVPLTTIFNKCYRERKWPSLWKSETVVTIPKNDSPESLNDLRNLSCTPLFSKIMEFFVLERMKKETTLRANQYGGRKGSGCEHYIIRLLTEIHEALDQKDAVCNILAVDFKKAFNTMNHNACLQQLKENGASEYLISMIHAFLYGRIMRVRLGQALSDPLTIKGGSPQGTLLGNLLFTLTTNKIEDENEPTIEQIRPQIPQTVSYEDLGRCVSTPMGVERTISGISDISDMSTMPSAGVRLTERTLRYDMSGSDTESDEDSLDQSFWMREIPPPTNWKSRPMATVKFIDDLTAASAAFLPASYQIFTEAKPKRVIHAKRCQDFYATVEENASKLGLSVNHKKTQLVCVNSAIGSTPSSYIQLASGEKIHSQQSIKILGFHIGASSGMAEQVAQLKKKYRSRAWVVRNLKRAGLPPNELVKMYKVLVRPVLDYMTAAYHPMLNLEQRKELERLQMTTLKTIYGYDVSYAKALEESGLPTLEERRQDYFDRFALKLANNSEYSDWLPKSIFTGYDLREEHIYKESFASTDRLRNSPLYAIRRRLNEINIYQNKPDRTSNE